ncbi:MAG: GlsB/YeaQ/YmgE family stress response membrane protein [Tissierellia bacterium]|nr:GlsB/YeaQ/YmgE family stress response membrane protein [Tissierellia bacterium]
MGILSWIIIGALAGWLASKMMNTDQSMGALANIVVGIIGGVLGGFIMGFFNKSGVQGFSLYSLGVAFLGAIVLLAILKAISRK